MKTLTLWIAGVLAVGTLLSAAGSLARAATEKGDRELGLNVDTGTTTTSVAGVTSTTSTTNVLASYGYFLDKQQQVGGAVDYFITKSETDTTQFIYYQGFYKYHFILPEKPELVPFVSGYFGQLQFKGGGSSGTGLTYAAGGGVKYFVSETTSANAEFVVRRSTVSIGGETATISDNRLFLGLSIYFGRK